MRMFTLSVFLFLAFGAISGSALAAGGPLPPPRIEADPASPSPGDVVRYRIQLANPRGQDASGVNLTLQWPDWGHPVGLAGLDGAEYDHEDREIKGRLDLPAGAEHVVELDVLTPRQLSQFRLGLQVRLFEPWSDTDQWARHDLDVERDYAATGVVFGPVRVLPVAFVVLGWMLVSLLVLVILATLGTRRRGGQGLPLAMGPTAGAFMATACMMFAVAVWLYYGSMAWRDTRILSEWVPCTATVLGGRLVQQASIASTQTPRSASRSSQNRPTFTPELALRYDVAGQTVVSTGFDSGSALRSGGRSARAEELAQWQPGRQVPCWYDPDAPHDVVVQRGPGFAYLLALLPLPLFWLGWTLARGVLRSRVSAAG